MKPKNVANWLKSNLENNIKKFREKIFPLK